jgi:ATP-binding cassette subfamily B protein
MIKIREKAKGFFGLLAKTNRQFIPKNKRFSVFMVLFLLGITSQWWLVGAWFFGQLVNKLSNQPHVFGDVSIFALVVISVALDIFFKTLSFYKNILLQKTYTAINNQVQKRFWFAYSRYDLQDRESAKMQDALSNAQNNQTAISELFQTEIDTIYNIIILVVAMTALTTVIWWGIILLLIVVCPRIYFSWKRKSRQYKNEKDRQEIGRYRSSLSSFISTKDARINDAQASVLSLFDSLRTKMTNVVLKNNILFFRIVWFNDSMFYLAQGIILVYLVYQIQNGVQPVGVLFVVFSSFSRLYDSLVSITDKIVTLGISIKKAEDFYLVLDGTPAIVDDPKAQEVDNTIAPFIEFRSVGFKYPDTKDWILKDCSFSIKAGQRIGLVAKNGEGKTTIALLLLRFYDVDEGSILINGIDIRLIKRDTLLSITGVLFQDFRLLEGSTRFALTAFNFKRAFSNHELWSSLEKVGMKDYIKKLELGLDHKISKIFSNSKKLSGGQSQKIGLAGVICKDPKLLILDEFTSSLDPEAEAEIVKQYESLSKGRTCLIISHRYNTLDLVDEIILLSGGKIAEQGTKEELLSTKEGVFKRLYAASRLSKDYLSLS